MGEGFGERETPLVDGEGPAEYDAGDGVGGFGATFEDGAYGFEPLGVVARELGDPAIEVIEKGAVAGENEVRTETAQAVEGLKVPGERARLRLGPEPDIRCYPEHYMVGGEEDASCLVVEYELVIGMAGSVENPRRALT